MRGLAVTKAAALCAATAFVAAMGPASASPAAAPASSGRAAVQQVRPTVLVDCLSKPQVRPVDFMLACGDGNSRLASLRWARWDAASAEAKGVNRVNDCKPYCAAGTFHSYRVVVRLDEPRSWKKDPQQKHYTRMTLTYTGDRPERLARTVTYTLWN
ncbi:hypothetical protein [Streptomyces sp. AC555_RSS877]|uniref:hypothetical protein n=1 Tax=Streptomyces sp. AC555_RSS877 TaxID=2823688 RepID=UPI001C25878B|nr:hypothetical protein [Streptomyces sp. AC555_RSS877]